MKIDGDYAIIETAEEAGCIVDLDPSEKLSEWEAVLGCDSPNAETQISRAQVLEAITPKEGDAVFDTHPGPKDTSPRYFREWTIPIKGVIKANALTIGKTVGELRELLEWCKG